jgi:hypothetical protein
VAHLEDEAVEAGLYGAVERRRIQPGGRGEADAPGGAHRLAGQIDDRRPGIVAHERGPVERGDRDAGFGGAGQGVSTSIVAL